MITRHNAIVAVLLVLAALLPAQAAQAAPALSWTGCGAGLQCATLTVPLDHSRPSGRTISLAIIRRLAGDPAHRVGSLVFNPGGPGGSGIDFVHRNLALVPPELLARFDFVTFDPRGVGSSTPVHCFASLAEQQAFAASVPAFFPVGPAQEQTYTRAYQDYGARCARRNAGLLPHMSTANVARDVDLLRQALGESSLTYFGVSYGSYLGTTYANLFPQRVRALLLDGADDPVQWVGGADRNRVPTFVRTRADIGSSQTMAQFLDMCADAGPRCEFAVGTDRKVTADRFNALMNIVRRQPVPVATPRGTVQLTYAIAADAIAQNALFTQTAFPLLARALNRLDHGDGTLLLQFAGLYATPTTYDNATESGTAVLCVDGDNPAEPAAWPGAARDADQRAPHFGSLMAYFSFPCAAWQARDAGRYTGPFDRPTAHPVLVVGNRFDPATPYEGAVALRHRLADARLLTLDGWGHTALLQPSKCAHDAEVRYLVDGTLPAAGTVCTPDAGPFDVPAP
jgi:pimeloyl-ACP methyl ester carboxylesterase